MKVSEIMTKDPQFCTPETALIDAAKLMCDRDCGELPVLESSSSMRPVGVVTDRDIICRTLAVGKDPFELKVKDCMSPSPVSVSPDADVDDCCDMLALHQIRRVLVVDEDGRCCGIVSQADIARECAPEKAGEVIREVSHAA